MILKLKNEWNFQEVPQGLTFNEVKPLFESVADEAAEKEMEKLKQKSD